MKLAEVKYRLEQKHEVSTDESSLYKRNSMIHKPCGINKKKNNSESE